MKFSYWVATCLLLTHVFSSTIGTSPVDISSNGLQNSPISVSSDAKKQIQDLNVDELGAMIEQLLAELQSTKEDHSNIAPSNSQNDQTSQSNNNQPETIQVQQEPIKQPTPEVVPTSNNNRPVSTVQQNDEPESSGFVNFSPIGGQNSGFQQNIQINANNQQNERQNRQEKKEPSQASGQQSQTIQPQQESQIPNDESQTSNVIQAPVSSLETQSEQMNQQQTDKLVNDLLTGNYFTYFVDLNAAETGNIFLNDPQNQRTNNQANNGGEPQNPQKQSTNQEPIKTEEQKQKKQQKQQTVIQTNQTPASNLNKQEPQKEQQSQTISSNPVPQTNNNQQEVNTPEAQVISQQPEEVSWQEPVLRRPEKILTQQAYA